MPAIRPERLRRRAAEVAATVEDPPELERRLLDLLEFYADRTRRAPEAISAADASSAFGVPPPVLVAIERSLLAALPADLVIKSSTVEMLWAMGYRESRMLAAAILSSLDWEQSHEQVEGYIRLSGDRRVQRELAEKGLQGWRAANLSEVRKVLARWLRARDDRVLRLALVAIRTQVAASSPTALRPYYQLLEGLPPRVYQSAAAELQEVVAALAAQNPAEAAQYLMDELRGSNRSAHHRQLIKSTLAAFPGPQREKLTAILSR